jgi:predicted transcriptional regulator
MAETTKKRTTRRRGSPKVNVVIRVSPDTKTLLEQLSDRTGLTMSQVAQHAVTRFGAEAQEHSERTIESMLEKQERMLDAVFGLINRLPSTN